jgi:hypothetical protein
MNGYPSLSQNDGSESHSSNGVGPRLAPNRVYQQSSQSNPGHITAEGRFRSISLQRLARSNDCQLPFPAGEPRHYNCGGQQDSNSDQAPLRFEISEKVQNGSKHYESRKREKQNSHNLSCPCLVQFEPKTPEHDGCRKQLDQTVSYESEKSGSMRTPSRPERNESFRGHPDDGENLELENAPRDTQQLGLCGCDHAVLSRILFIQSCNSNTENARWCQMVCDAVLHQTEAHAKLVVQ